MIFYWICIHPIGARGTQGSNYFSGGTQNSPNTWWTTAKLYDQSLNNKFNFKLAGLACCHYSRPPAAKSSLWTSAK